MLFCTSSCGGIWRGVTCPCLKGFAQSARCWHCRPLARCSQPGIEQQPPGPGGMAGSRDDAFKTGAQ
eukprot:5457745-Pyramimonas_sp.AAC.1